MTMAIPSCFWIPFAWHITFHLLTFSLYGSLALRCFLKTKKFKFWFLIQSVSHQLIVVELKQFKFRDIHSWAYTPKNVYQNTIESLAHHVFAELFTIVLETAQMVHNWWMDLKNAVYTHNGELFSQKEEQNCIICR
jgi:hypothetical protein